MDHRSQERTKNVHLSERDPNNSTEVRCDGFLFRELDLVKENPFSDAPKKKEERQPFPSRKISFTINF